MIPEMELTLERLWKNSKKVSQDLGIFIKTSVGNFSREGVIVGSSGGIDSSVLLAVSVATLDSTRVLGLIMPEKDNSQDSESDARFLAETLGIGVEKIEMRPQKGDG